MQHLLRHLHRLLRQFPQGFNRTTKHHPSNQQRRHQRRLPPLLDFPHDDRSPIPTAPSPSIYQDYSPPQSPDLPDVPPLPVPSPSNYPEMSPSPPISPADSKKAPSFAEFTRNLPAKPFDMVSPLSADGSEGYHRQLAMDALAPPSPQESPNMHPVAFEGNDIYLPGPMSGTITHVVAPSMIPPPLDLSRSSRSISPSMKSSRAEIEQTYRPNSFEEFLQQGASTAASAIRKNSSITSSRDKFTHYHQQRNEYSPRPSISPLEGPDLHHGHNQEILTSQRYFTEDEKYRIMSYASQKYPGMTSTTGPTVAPPPASGPPPHAQQNTLTRMKSARSSVSKRASSLLRSLSVRRESHLGSPSHPYQATANNTAAVSGPQPQPQPPPQLQPTRNPTEVPERAISMQREPSYTPPRAHRAIQPTSYQLYGEASWSMSKDSQKRRGNKKEKRTSKESNKSEDGGGGGGKAGFLGKLTRSASERRREKLKNSIKVVGSVEVGAMGGGERGDRRWVGEDPRKFWD